MTHKQRLELELSEKRQKLNDLLAKTDLNDDGRKELETLTTRMQQAESRI